MSVFLTQIFKITSNTLMFYLDFIHPCKKRTEDRVLLSILLIITPIITGLYIYPYSIDLD